MKHNILILFICFTLKSFSQEKPIAFHSEIIYKMVYQPDSTNKNNIKEEYAELRLNDTISVFRTIAKRKIDSVESSVDLSRIPPSFYMENNTDIHYTIVKKPDSVLHYEVLHRDLLDLYYFSESKNVFEWEINSDTMIIADISCQKATLNFGGRKWIAWFALDIPVSDGPYKFCNLPGLILSVHDTQEYWRFDVVSINPDKRGNSWIYTVSDSPPQSITKTDFFKKKAIYRKSIFETLLAEGRFNGVKQTALEKVRIFYNNEANRDNNWIELYPQ